MRSPKWLQVSRDDESAREFRFPLNRQGVREYEATVIRLESSSTFILFHLTPIPQRRISLAPPSLAVLPCCRVGRSHDPQRFFPCLPQETRETVPVSSYINSPVGRPISPFNIFFPNSIPPIL
jgi:hypothetical protein